MWYVIWTSTGSEEKTVEAVKSLRVSNRCFVPRRVVPIKRGGKWITMQKPLFPGYIFTDAEDPEELAIEVRKIEGFHQVLNVEKEFYPLSGKEEELVENMYLKEGLFDMSEGLIEGDKIIVTSGPLVGLEGNIKKLARHKRLAYLEFDMFDQIVKATVGLEIVEKK